MTDVPITTVRLNEKDLASFLSKISPEPNSGCWLWDAACKGGGYASMYLSATKRIVSAHRVAYEHFVGPIPDNKQLDHLCRVRSCVNPAHLEPVDFLENVRRGECWSFHSSKTHCKHGHEFTPENTVLFTSRGRSQRGCRVCRSARSLASGRTPAGKEKQRLRDQKKRSRTKEMAVAHNISRPPVTPES